MNAITEQTNCYKGWYTAYCVSIIWLFHFCFIFLFSFFFVCFLYFVCCCCCSEQLRFCIDLVTWLQVIRAWFFLEGGLGDNQLLANIYLGVISVIFKMCKFCPFLSPLWFRFSLLVLLSFLFQTTYS